jgi:hypothetical protein
MRKNLAGNETMLMGIVLLLLTTLSAGAATASKATQAQAVADIATGIVVCSAHPCLGDSEKDTRLELHNQIISDGSFYFSNLAKAYPAAQRQLSGLVEWEFDPDLDMVSLKITNLRVGASSVIEALEHALPGCQMERDDDFETEVPDETKEGDEDSTREWSCSAQGYGNDDVLVEVYSIPGLLLLEIGS